MSATRRCAAGDEVTSTDSQVPRLVVGHWQPGKQMVEGEDDDEDLDGDEESSSDYLSFAESDDDEDGETSRETKADREARAHERQLVLEAAGLILMQNEDEKPPVGSASGRTRSMRRRPPPAAPVLATSRSKALPPVPRAEREGDASARRRVEDAFDRYESFKNKAHAANRVSIASTVSAETLLSVPSPTGSSHSQSGSQTHHGHGQGVEGGKSYSQYLMNLLGRTRTPEGGGGDAVGHGHGHGHGLAAKKSVSIASISAPIVSPSSSGMNGGGGSGEHSPRGASPAFGTSWASMVDRTALEGIPSGERHRQEAIFELIHTEGAYVRDLQLIVEIFYSSMLSRLSPEEVTVIFANIEDILLTNTTFLSVLEERQKECRLYMDKIGDILLDHIPNMVVYMEYCVNQATAIKVLKSSRDTNSDVEAHLQKLKNDPAVRNLDLSSYLLIPMQRITRYPLLVKQILNYTESEDEREDIGKAIDISEKLLDHINESIREQEGREKLKTLSRYLWVGHGRLDLTAPTRYMGSRRLLKEGFLHKAKSGRKLYGFLCTDILVLTDESMKSLYRMPIPLAHARVIGGKDDLTFEVSQAYPRGGDSILLKAPSNRDCQAWTQEIEYAARRCRHAEDRGVRKMASRK